MQLWWSSLWSTNCSCLLWCKCSSYNKGVRTFAGLYLFCIVQSPAERCVLRLFFWIVPCLNRFVDDKTCRSVGYQRPRCQLHCICFPVVVLSKGPEQLSLIVVRRILLWITVICFLTVERFPLPQGWYQCARWINQVNSRSFPGMQGLMGLHCSNVSIL